MGDESANYGADAIQILEGVDAVRKRPGMYVGNVADGSALHHLLWEVVENAVDEHLAGFGDRIVIHLHDDGSVSVIDEGRGIPVEMHKERGVPVAEVVMTALHAGGMFTSNSYAISAGTHGPGVSVVNALSSALELEICREGRVWRQSYRQGKPLGPLLVVDSTSFTGTRITFHPDPAVFTCVTRLDVGQVAARLRELAALCPGLRFDLHHGDCVRSLCFPQGISALVEEVCAGKDVVLPSVMRFSGSERLEKGGEIKVEVALQWCQREGGHLDLFVNGGRNMGGTHARGLVAGMLQGLRAVSRQRGGPPVRGALSADVTRRTAAAVRVWHPSPSYGSRCKEILVCKDTGKLLRHLTAAKVRALLVEHPEALEVLRSVS